MVKNQTILKSVKQRIPIVIAKMHEPKEFFKDRKGLYVWGSFIENILSKAKPTKAKTKFNIASFDLVESASDENIEKSLPKKHLFSETDVCAIIADLIEKQSKGQKGILVNTGYANLFYTKSRVVSVGLVATGMCAVGDAVTVGGVRATVFSLPQLIFNYDENY